MSTDDYDIAIIGAGIHGAGVAQAGAAAGYRVLLLEKSQAAAGTSSRSSKLIHGGLRYLETAQFALVRESLRERRYLLRNAPDLVRLTPFYIPVYADTIRRPWKLRSGLALYSVLGGLGTDTRFGTVPRRLWHHLSHLRLDGLQEVFTYFDAQTDDARLTRAVVASAVSLGAEFIAPARLLYAWRDERGYALSYHSHHRAFECRTRVLINAAGPWVNEVQKLLTPQPPTFPIDLVQGTHLVFDKPVALGIYYVEAPRDRRGVFIMPWKNGALVGTTENIFSGHPDQAAPLDDEVQYLAETLAAYFPRYDGRQVATMTGLRVLPKAEGTPFGRSRETVLLPDDRVEPNALAIYGGKLTAYRATAEKVLHLFRHRLPARQPIADTRTLRLSAGP